MNSVPLLVLRDQEGRNWGVYVFHDGPYKYIYTQEVDEPGVDFVKIKTFAGYKRIKIGTNGQIYTYSSDDLD